MKTKIVKVDPYNINVNVIKEAANILQRGGIVAFPTETVYGLAADYNNKSAIDKLYIIKRRPKKKPFTIHIASKEKMLEFLDEPDELTKRLIDKFWPGPLTIIVKTKDGKNLGFRMPSNRVALELIKLSNLTIVAPSANISGRLGLVEPFSVVETFDGLIDVVIDAGPTEIGTPSTIVDITTLHPQILREGSNVNEVKAILQEDKRITNMLIVCTGNSCRSPMAEALLKKELEKDGFNIKSAGIIAIDGRAASAETVEVMKRFANIDLSKFTTHRLTKELTGWADIILVMDTAQKDIIENTTPEAKQKIYLYKKFANIASDNPNVPDPIGKPFYVYEQSFKQIQQGIGTVVKKLREGRG